MKEMIAKREGLKDLLKNLFMESGDNKTIVIEIEPEDDSMMEMPMDESDLSPHGFEMHKAYDILKGKGKDAEKVGEGMEKIGMKSIGPVAIQSKSESCPFKNLKERLESEE